MAGNFLKLPRAAQKAAFAHMGDEHKGRFSGALDEPGRGRISGTLGSGALHGQLTAKRAERPAAGRQQVDKLREAYNGGHKSIYAMEGGKSADMVDVLELSDGTRAVRKRQTEHDTRSEYLGGRVATALGITDVTTAQVSGRETVTTFVDGDTGAARLKKVAREQFGGEKQKAAVKAETDRQTHLRNGREIAMLDWLTENHDRHGLNWIISSDGKSVVPIDHGSVGWGAGGPIKGREVVPSTSPFVKEWVRPKTEGYRGFVSADPQWTPAELAKIRTSIEALRGEFTTGNEPRWFDSMLRRLDLLEGA